MDIWDLYIYIGVDISAVDTNGENALLMAAAACLLPPLRNQHHALSTAEVLLAAAGGGGAHPSHLLHQLSHAQVSAAHLFHKLVHDLSIPVPIHLSLVDPTFSDPRSSAPAESPAEEELEPRQRRTPMVSVKSSVGASVTCLLGPRVKHVGAGSWVIDDAFSDQFLARLDTLWREIPAPPEPCSSSSSSSSKARSRPAITIPPLNSDPVDTQPGLLGLEGKVNNKTKRTFGKTYVSRSFFRDRTNTILQPIQQALRSLTESSKGSENHTDPGNHPPPIAALPRLRFVWYGRAGDRMEPHVDLSKSDRIIPVQPNNPSSPGPRCSKIAETDMNRSIETGESSESPDKGQTGAGVTYESHHSLPTGVHITALGRALNQATPQTLQMGESKLEGNHSYSSSDTGSTDMKPACLRTVMSTHTFLLHLRDCPEGGGGETVLLRSLVPSQPKQTKQTKQTKVMTPMKSLENWSDDTHVNNTSNELRAKGSDLKELSRELSSSHQKGSTEETETETAAMSELSGVVRGLALETHVKSEVLASVRPKRGRLLLFPHICPHAGLSVVEGGSKLFLRGELYCPQL